MTERELQDLAIRIVRLERKTQKTATDHWELGQCRRLFEEEQRKRMT